MKILLVHNTYQQRGGEDEVFDAQADILERHGHTVVKYVRSNKEIEGLPLKQKWAFLAKDASWSPRTYAEVRGVIAQHRPDVAVVHNTFYMISPSVYAALQEQGVPIVQCLYSYRWLLGRAGQREFPEFAPTRLKEFFLTRFLVPRILNTLARQKIFQEKVRHFICLSEFSKQVYVKHGYDASRISVIAPSMPPAQGFKKEASSYGLFVGRLCDYKGVRVLLKAMQLCPGRKVHIIGNGPLRQEVEQAARSNKNITYLGWMSHEQMAAEMENAAFLVFPSLCYETFGKVLIEAFRCATPVVASRNTTAEEIVEDAKSGYLFNQNDPADLALKMKQLFEDPSLASQMGQAARQACQECYSEELNYKKQMALFDKVLKEHQPQSIH